VLSRDDEKIAEEGRSCGLDVPFLRLAELAGDLAPAIEAWRHAWLASEEHYGCHFDISVLLQPTTPLRRTEDVEQTVPTGLCQAETPEELSFRASSDLENPILRPSRSA
jgi:CMP-N-acetylneuraminic acid synthetase